MSARRRLGTGLPASVRILTRRSALVLALAFPILFTAGMVGEENDPHKPVAEMTLEELAQVEVTTVSKKPESRLEAAAAVYVITQEDIHRSGVTTLVEALRLAPGVEVARINASQWAVGIRGFTSRFSRAVLVLIDGRSVYTPLFAGVYWEAQDTLLEDVDRIEVIRGPGGALWGANAVDGVINIITKRAGETQGGMVSGGGGTEDRVLAAARYGGTIGDNTSYRVYEKYSDRDAEFHSDGHNFDAWHLEQGGFRADSTLSPLDTFTFQGDAYASRIGQQATPSFYTPPFIETVYQDATLSGANVLGRWTHAHDDGSRLVFQAYYDHTGHEETIFTENRDTIDFDLQDGRHLGSHDLTFGLGFRWSSSDTKSIQTVVISPALRVDQLYSGFIQDEFPIVSNRLRMTLGLKVEHNVFTGFELQPTARLLWTPQDGQYAWAAVSRAVRTPSRVEFDVSRSTAIGPTIPAYFRLTGDGNFVSEKVIAYEAGYRIRIGSVTVLDLAGYYNDLSDLTSGEPAGPLFLESNPPPAHLVLPFVFRNGLQGRSRGGEIAADTGIASWLTVRASYSYLALDLRPGPGSVDTTSVANTEGSSPRHKVSLTAFVNLPHGLAADAVLRYTSALPAAGASGVVDLDLRLGFRPMDALEVSLVGQGLLRPQFLYFAGGETGNVEIQRAFYGKLTWTF
jgi:iron complex outermembrane receptor protein